MSKRTNNKPLVTLLSIILFCLGLSLTTIGHAEIEAVVVGKWCNDDSGPCDAAFRVNLFTGQRTLLSAYTTEDHQRAVNEFNGGSTSELSLNRGGNSWFELTISQSGEIYLMTNQDRYSPPGRGGTVDRTLYAVDATNGSRRFVSVLQDSVYGGLELSRLEALPTGTILGVGRYLTSTPGRSSPNTNGLFSIDATTGQTALLSYSGQSSQGPIFGEFLDVDSSGRIFVGSTMSGYTVFEVDTLSGIRTEIGRLAGVSFKCHGASNIGSSVDLSGKIYCAKNIFNEKALYVIDTATNSAPVKLSDYSNPSQGPLIFYPVDQTLWTTGNLLQLDNGDNGKQGLGGIYLVDTQTGIRSLISNFQDATQGPPVYNARAMAIGDLPAFVGIEDNGNSGGGNGGSDGSPSQPTDPEPMISKVTQSSPVSVQVEEPYSYTVTWSNSGASEALNSKLTDSLPKKSTLLSAVPSQGICSGKRLVVCKFGTVSAGAAVTVTLNLSVRKPGTARNTAVVAYKAVRAGSKKKRGYKLKSVGTTVVTR